MLKRFSLYGFLKNQRYYEPFLLLAFLQMGLNYTWIGILAGFREVMLNLMEIPSGAVADLFGRRKSMIFSFCAYIVSFGLTGGAGLAAQTGRLSPTMLIVLLFPAMFLFAIGDAFRTGTHKAMIFTWLRINDRVDERTKIYGYTRSWSMIGSAVSVVLASLFVYFTSNFIYVFFLAIIPYALNIINFMGYPEELDRGMKKGLSVSEVVSHLQKAFRVTLHVPSLRRLILESMGFGGFFKAAKDYLQPILKAAALPISTALFAGLAMSEEQSAVLLVGPVYLVLFLLSAFASRKAHLLVDHHGHEDRTARFLWLANLMVLVLLIPAMVFGLTWFVVVGFAGLYILQNLWRPVQISRLDACSDKVSGATILSIESQGKSISTMILAPLLGYLIDLVQGHSIGATPFWPVAVIGAAVALFFFVTAGSRDTKRYP